MQAYTADAAYALGMENFAGSLEVGKRADMMLLDQDIFNIPTEDIPETNVVIKVNFLSISKSSGVISSLSCEDIK